MPRFFLEEQLKPEPASLLRTSVPAVLFEMIAVSRHKHQATKQFNMVVRKIPIVFIRHLIAVAEYCEKKVLLTI